MRRILKHSWPRRRSSPARPLPRRPAPASSTTSRRPASSASASRSPASRSASATPRTTRSATTSTWRSGSPTRSASSCEITDVSGAVRITMLQSGQIDIVIANMTATLERAKAVDFTIPYLRSGIKLLIARGHRRQDARRPQRQEGARRPRHDRRDHDQGAGARTPRWSTSTPSRRRRSCCCSRSAPTRRSRIPTLRRLRRQAEPRPDRAARHLHHRPGIDRRRQGRSGIRALARHVRVGLHLERRLPGELYSLVRPAGPGADVALVDPGRTSKIPRRRIAVAARLALSARSPWRSRIQPFA